MNRIVLKIVLLFVAGIGVNGTVFAKESNTAVSDGIEINQPARWPKPVNPIAAGSESNGIFPVVTHLQGPNAVSLLFGLFWQQ